MACNTSSFDEINGPLLRFSAILVRDTVASPVQQPRREAKHRTHMNNTPTLNVSFGLYARDIPRLLAALSSLEFLMIMSMGKCTANKAVAGREV